MIAAYATNYWIASRAARRRDLEIDPVVALRALHSMAHTCPHKCVRGRAARTLVDCGLGGTLMLASRRGVSCVEPGQAS
jgi:hypothetical protein